MFITLEYFNNAVPYRLSEGTPAIKKEGTEEKKKEEDGGF